MEQLWGAALGSRSSLEEQLARQLRTEALKNRSFGEQFWGLALERNFGGQLSVATLRSSFREPLWRIAFKFGEPLWEQTGLKAALGQPLCGGPQSEAAAGNRFGEQL